MKIMLLAKYFPQVAASATKSSESLHLWSGPEMEKNNQVRKAKSLFSDGQTETRTRANIVRKSEDELSVGLRRVT